MRNTAWTVLIWGLPICAAIAMLYETGYAHGKAEAEAEAGREFSINKAAQEAQAMEKPAQITPTQRTLDKHCPAWLFDTNAKDAKRRICGK